MTDRVPFARVDRRYAPLWAQCAGHPGPLSAAGWFDDGLTDAARDALMKTDLLTTPLNKVSPVSGRKNLVLVGMGSFAPVHEGHLGMLTAARDALVSRGHHVSGGFLSPSHDAYVLTKPGVSMGIAARIEALLAATRDSWVAVDPWEGVWVDVALNLTTVLDRTEAYLRRHMPDHDFEAVAVFGSDNVGFAGAFLDEGRFVCVSRDPAHDMTATEARVDPDRGVFVRGKEILTSSTKVRAAQKLMPPGSAEEDGTVYVLRDDLALSAPVPVSVADAEALTRILADHAPRPVRVIPAETQIAAARRAIPEPVVSLDVHFPGEVMMDLTRLFEVSDPQTRPVDLIPRDETAILGVPAPVPHVLVDDDKASGYTVAQARKILEAAGVEISREVFLNTALIPEGETHDVVDSRDFLLFARHGGLTVRIPGVGIARAPYWAPFVDLTSRATIARRSHLDFTRRVLLWNREIFRRASPFFVRDAQERQRRWAKACGFKDTDTALDILDWMLRMVERAG